MGQEGSGFIGTPQGLLYCVFFYNGKYLCLRGGDEHRCLKMSQLKPDVVTVDGSKKRCYVYTEHGSKNRSGGFGQFHVENKIVRHFEVPEAGERDYVHLYLSKLPKEAIKKDHFYVRPLTVLKPGQPWYSSVPIGKNKLTSMVRTMCSLAGIQGNKTNHSLRSFGVSSMFEQQIPEKIIQERSGHRSLDALRVYEKTTNQQKIAASRVMTACMPSTSDYEEKRNKEYRRVAVKTMRRNQLANHACLELPEKPDPQMFHGCSFSNCTFSFKN